MEHLNLISVAHPALAKNTLNCIPNYLIEYFNQNPVGLPAIPFK